MLHINQICMGLSLKRMPSPNRAAPSSLISPSPSDTVSSSPLRMTVTHGPGKFERWSQNKGTTGKISLFKPPRSVQLKVQHLVCVPPWPAGCGTPIQHFHVLIWQPPLIGPAALALNFLAWGRGLILELWGMYLPTKKGRETRRNRPKQVIRTSYLDHVTGYQPISDQYFLIRSVPGNQDQSITVHGLDLEQGPDLCLLRREFAGDYLTILLWCYLIVPRAIRRRSDLECERKAENKLSLGKLLSRCSLLCYHNARSIQQEPTETSKQPIRTCYFISRDWLSANQGSVFPDSVVPLRFDLIKASPSFLRLRFNVDLLVVIRAFTHSNHTIKHTPAHHRNRPKQLNNQSELVI
eukprot:sb/3466186/